jgi:hypothetical protein
LAPAQPLEEVDIPGLNHGLHRTPPLAFNLFFRRLDEFPAHSAPMLPVYRQAASHPDPLFPVNPDGTHYLSPIQGDQMDGCFIVPVPVRTGENPQFFGKNRFPDDEGGLQFLPVSDGTDFDG